MRAILFGLLLVSARSLPAQNTATANIEVRVAVPDLLAVHEASSENYTRPDGTRVRRVTLYVSANRMWNLRIVKDGVVVGNERGGNGTNLQVTVEIPLRSDEQTQEAFDIAYLLTAA